MSKHRWGAVMMLAIAGMCLATERLFEIPVGIVAVFVVGLGGGLLIGEEMSKDAEREAGG